VLAVLPPGQAPRLPDALQRAYELDDVHLDEMGAQTGAGQQLVANAAIAASRVAA
jgi:hypothetical protein